MKTNALARLKRTVFPDCRESARLQSLQLDGTLTLPQRAALRFHLLICKWCRRYGRQIRFLRQAARATSCPAPDDPSTGLSAPARERIKEALRHEP